MNYLIKNAVLFILFISLNAFGIGPNPTTTIDGDVGGNPTTGTGGGIVPAPPGPGCMLNQEESDSAFPTFTAMLSSYRDLTVGCSQTLCDSCQCGLFCCPSLNPNNKKDCGKGTCAIGGRMCAGAGADSCPPKYTLSCPKGVSADSGLCDCCGENQTGYDVEENGIVHRQCYDKGKCPPGLYPTHGLCCSTPSSIHVIHADGSDGYVCGTECPSGYGMYGDISGYVCCPDGYYGVYGSVNGGPVGWRCEQRPVPPPPPPVLNCGNNEVCGDGCCKTGETCNQNTLRCEKPDPSLCWSGGRVIARCVGRVCHTDNRGNYWCGRR